MKKQIQQLIEWHTKFEVPYKTEPDPFDDSDEEQQLKRLRARIMTEEVKEWESSAIYCEDVDKRAKELADILYTVFGTIITEGLQDQIERVFDEVHASNMSKLGPDGKPVKRHDGKVLKGPNYKEPDLSFLKNKALTPKTGSDE
jgi:NTP pyrophosphatase (non-canonical NTP hydrolase)